MFNVKCSTCIDLGIKNNDKDPKFKVGEHVRISKYKNIFAKNFVPNWSEVFLIKKVKIFFRGHILLATLTVKKLRQIKKNFRQKKKL